MTDAPLSKFQKLMLINAHPVKMVFNTVGGIIGLYFLWEHKVLWAFLIGGAFIFSGTALSVKNKMADTVIAESWLGKIFLRYFYNPGLYMLFGKSYFDSSFLLVS